MQELKERLLAMREQDGTVTQIGPWVADEVAPGFEFSDLDMLVGNARERGRAEGERKGRADFERYVLPAREAAAETRGALVVLEHLVEAVAAGGVGEDGRVQMDWVLSSIAGVRSVVGHDGLSGERKERRRQQSVGARW